MHPADTHASDTQTETPASLMNAASVLGQKASHASENRRESFNNSDPHVLISDLSLVHKIIMQVLFSGARLVLSLCLQLFVSLTFHREAVKDAADLPH